MSPIETGAIIIQGFLLLIVGGSLIWYITACARMFMSAHERLDNIEARLWRAEENAEKALWNQQGEK